MERDIKEILFSESDIAVKIQELGKQITRDYEGKDLIVIGVLKGANMFLSDIIRQVKVPMELDFIAVSSYGKSTKSSGVVRFLKDLDLEIENKHIIIVEDIVDTGLTLNYLIHILNERNPSSIKTCALFDKPSRRKVAVTIDYRGFDTPDKFIVGYGIDFAEKYRNLPYVGVLKEEVYSK